MIQFMHKILLIIFADVDQFFDFNNDIQEIFAHKTCVRSGPGYTHSCKEWFEVLLVYDYARHDVYAIDCRYRLFF